jgi:general secretion pathway protein J
MASTLRPAARLPHRLPRFSKGLGLTLIELMVALAVVAVLGVISYRAVAAATDSRDRLSSEYQRWRDITRFVQMTENDMTQMVARPTSANSAGVSLLLTSSGADGGVELSFLKLDGARASARRVGYRLDGTHIVLLRWAGTDAATAPMQDVVLDQVKALRFAFITANGLSIAAWPPPPAGTPPLPEAIEMQLELADVGTVRRLVALH